MSIEEAKRRGLRWVETDTGYVDMRKVKEDQERNKNTVDAKDAVVDVKAVEVK